MVVVACCLWEPSEQSFAFSRCYTEQWVERLYDGFKRNTTRDFEFVCFVDRERTFTRPITQIALERRPIDYGSCIEPYKLDRPMIMVGLDTVVTGNVDLLFDYCLTGHRILLPRDPFFPEKACNGVALVPAGNKAVYTEWNGENDMEWMRSWPHDLIEYHFPGMVESYKGAIKHRGLGDCRIVYFHGKEKPHEILVDWIEEHWGPPLLSPIKWVDALNNDPGVMFEQVRTNLERDVPFLAPRNEHKGSALIVGGGPSLADSLTKLRFHQQRGGDIYALNGTHDWLIERGIIPDYHVLLDSRPDNVCFVQKPHKAVKYLIGAQCHPCMFEALKGHDVTLWISDADGMQELVRNREDKPIVLIGGGATVGMKTMYMAYLLGYRRLHFFGFDSSYKDEQNHAYPQPLNANESRIEIQAGDKRFMCAPWMAKQAMEFQKQARKLLELGCHLTVHGDGLIPHIMEIWNAADRNRRRSTVG